MTSPPPPHTPLHCPTIVVIILRSQALSVPFPPRTPALAPHLSAPPPTLPPSLSLHHPHPHCITASKTQGRPARRLATPPSSEGLGALPPPKLHTCPPLPPQRPGGPCWGSEGALSPPLDALAAASKKALAGLFLWQASASHSLPPPIFFVCACLSPLRGRQTPAAPPCSPRLRALCARESFLFFYQTALLYARLSLCTPPQATPSHILDECGRHDFA